MHHSSRMQQGGRQRGVAQGECGDQGQDYGTTGVASSEAAGKLTNSVASMGGGCRQRHRCHAVGVNDDGPSEADYTTATDPERFNEVVDFAKELVSELGAEFVVERSDGDWSDEFPGFDVELTKGWPLPVCLRPSTGVPLVFGFTSIPGVVVRVGRNVELRFPDCLCDACNLQVDELCDELRFHVDAVTSGNFTETVGRRKHRWAFEMAGRRSSTEYRPPRRDRKALGERGKFGTELWERRRS